MKIKYHARTIVTSDSRFGDKKIHVHGKDDCEIKDLKVGEYGYDLHCSNSYPAERGYIIDIFEMTKRTSKKNYEYIYHIIVFDAKYEMGYYPLYDNILEVVMNYEPIDIVKQLIDFANL